MGTLIRFHARASTGSRGAGEGVGREISDGQSASGQLSENHCSARSRRRTLIPAPACSALIFFPSSKARELTVDNSTRSSSAYARATVSNCSMPVMNRISVSLPAKSTAILPDARPLRPGHITEMELDPFEQFLAVIDRRIAELKADGDKRRLTDNAIAKAVKSPDVIRNVRRHISLPKQKARVGLGRYLGIDLLNESSFHQTTGQAEDLAALREELRRATDALERAIDFVDRAARRAK